MAKTKISEWSSTPADNTDIDNININEGCSPSGINNAIRSMMSQVKNLQAGLSGDTIPVAAGGTGSSTAATARTALGAAASGANSDITSLTGLTTALSASRGGTGQTTYTDGQLLIGNSTGNTLTKATLTAGSGVTITNGSGSITISSSSAAVTAGSFVVGNTYSITTVGTTNFTSIGASSNTVGVIFTATGVGSGTGTATPTTTAASETVAGVIELATNAEVVTGTDTTRAITPKTYRDNLMTLTSSQATTSGTSVDFTSIPSWVKRITVMVQGFSTNGTSVPIIQLGTSSGFETSSYLGAASLILGTPTIANYSTGFLFADVNASTYVWHGSFIFTNLSGNIWVGQGIIGRSDGSRMGVSGGSKSLSAKLTQVRLTTVNGTDTFDAGSASIIYE